MEAPDKIYIDPMPNPSDGYVGIAWADAHGKMDKYIRNDSLLAWANEQNENAQYKFDDESGNMYWGYTIAIDELIDKLNSL